MLLVHSKMKLPKSMMILSVLSELLSSYNLWLPIVLSLQETYDTGTIIIHNHIMNPQDTTRIANALERIAQALEHFNIEHAHIDEIDHNHVEGDVNTHPKTW